MMNPLYGVEMAKVPLQAELACSLCCWSLLAVRGAADGAGLVCEAAGTRAAVFSLWGRLQGCWAAYERVFERSGPLRDAFEPEMNVWRRLIASVL